MPFFFTDDSFISEGTSKFATTEIDNVIASGFDEAGNLVERWVVPKGFDSVDDFLSKVDASTIQNYGYKNIDEFNDVVANANKHLNADDANKILNSTKAGTVYNGVEFDVLGFPVFKGDNLKFEFDLPSNLIVSPDKNQFEACTMALDKAIKDGLVPESMFTPNQLQDIIDGMPKIEGLTWHHHQVTGKMQLVPSIVHNTNHLGGNKLWGEGIR